MSDEAFRRTARRAVDHAADYLASLDDRGVRVSPETQPGDLLSLLPEHPPEQGADEAEWDRVFADLGGLIEPRLTHWQSPNFHAYFPCNTSEPAVVGEVLSAGYNVNGMLWATSPAATELEMRCLDWAAELLGLPERFTHRASTPGHPCGGCIQPTASDSTLAAITAGRHRATRGVPEGERLAAMSRCCVYTSTQAHSSVVKAAMIAGLAASPDCRARVRLIETDDRLRMDPEALRRAVRRDLDAGLVPACVVATFGTTSSTAEDPAGTIADVVRELAPACWVHVDAAFQGSVLLLPEHRRLDGLDRIDSLCFNPHKWLLTNFDCDLFYTADAASLVGSLSVTPEYLRNAASERGAVDFRDWGVPLGRRFRALKLWLVIRHYGAAGLRAYIAEHLRWAEEAQGRLFADDRFEQLAERTSVLLCFGLRAGSADRADALNRRLIERINASGEILLTQTTLPVMQRNADGSWRVAGSRFALRLAFGGRRSTRHSVLHAVDVVRRHATELLAEDGGPPG